VNKQTNSLVEDFQHFFDVEYVTTQEQIDEALGIRYRVYCEEFGYEPKERFPDRKESDQFDKKSLHCLVIHKSSRLPAGCVRLVLTNDTSDIDPLPFEEHCAGSLDQEFIRSFKEPRTTVGEISRLAVDTAFRRRFGDEATRFGSIETLNFSPQERRTFPLIAVAAYLATMALGELNGRSNGFAMMEPFLPRLMKRTGIVFKKVGEDIDYHGLRAPYFITLGTALTGMNRDMRSLYDAIYLNMKEAHQAIA